MDRREEASGDERERRATERVSSAAAVGRGMGLGLGWGWGPGGSRFIYGEEGGVLGPAAAGLLAVGPLRACRYFAGRAVPACGPRVRPKHGLHPRAVPARAHCPLGRAGLGPGLNSGLRAGLTGSGFVPRYNIHKYVLFFCLI